MIRFVFPFRFFFVKIALAYSQLGKHDVAISRAKRGVELSGGSTKVEAGLGIVQARAGNKGEAEKIIAKLLRNADTKNVSPQDIALIYSAIGDREKAFEWLEKSYEERTPWLIELNIDPVFDAIRDDPRFHDLAKRVGLDKR